MYRVKMTQALDFVKIAKGEIEYWNQPDIEDWSDGCARGRDSARNLIDFISNQEDPSLLGRVVKSIGRRQRFGAIETGFFTEISSDLIQHATAA